MYFYTRICNEKETSKGLALTFLEAYMRGWNEFDWKKALKEKWFSPNDIEMFQVEIHGYSPQEILEDNGIITD
jgi:hypothetical protein